MKNIIVVCPTCKQRVLPKADGTCPGCQRDISRVKPIEPSNKPSPPVKLQFKGSVTKQDFANCILLLNPDYIWARWFMSPIAAIIIFSMGYYVWLHGSGEIIKSVLEFSPALFFVGISLSPWWLPYLLLKSVYDQKNNIYRHEVFGTVNENEIAINNREISSVFTWNIYPKYKMEEDLLLLYQDIHFIHVFKPNMFNNNNDWEKFVSLVESKIPPR